MTDPSDNDLEDITLVDTIRQLSRRIGYTDSEAEAAHADFLEEVMEDMQSQLREIKRLRGVSLGT